MAWLAVPNDIAPCLAADSILSRFESNSFRLTAGGEGQLILACPAGTPENSPGFQAWEGIQTRTPSPEGTAESVRLFSLHKY